MNQALPDIPELSGNPASAMEMGRALGLSVYEGIPWRRLRPGFFWPLDIQTPLPSRARLPWHRAYLGWQYLCPPELANARLELMVLELEGFGLHRLKDDKRAVVRKGLRNCDIRPIRVFDAKECERARSIWNALVLRTGWRSESSADLFAREWSSWMELPGHLLVGAYNKADGMMVGWLLGGLFDSANAYVFRYAADEVFFPLRPNDAMIFSFVMAAQRLGMRRVNFGLPAMGAASLDRFKETLGFKRMGFPSRLELNPVSRWLVRALRPADYRRLKGEP